MPPSVVFYVSGHGFGHASRVIEVVNALAGRVPDLDIGIRTRAARWLFDLTVTAPFTLVDVDVDVGVVQVDALTPDIPATLARASTFYRDSDALIAREAQSLAECEAALVVADAPPLAFAAAARARVPSVALTNFTWEWIYRDYEDLCGTDTSVSDLIRDWHSLAREAWRLPMHGGFGGFERIRDLPFVARRSRRDRRELRAALGWDDSRSVVLESFGGVGMRRLPLDVVARSADLLVVTADESGAGGPPDGPLARTRPDGTIALDERRLYALGWRYEDVVAAADIVVTKPGYGIIAECAANDTAMLYTSRGRFREYEVLIESMPRWLRCRFIEQDDLLAGRWEGPIHALLAQAPPPERARVDGATVAAEWITESL